MRTYAVILLGVFALSDCTLPSANSEDKLLAEVHGRRLYMSDAEQILSPQMSPEDSISRLRSFVQLWVNEAVLLHEAEQKLGPDLDLDDLVKDYRNSLLISNYEKNVVETRVDTVITQQELQEYYQRNKEQYQLERPIVRGFFVKIDREVDSLAEFRGWWDSKDSLDFQRLAQFSVRNAEVFLLEDSTWYTVSDIEGLMPPGTLQSQNMRPNTSLRFTDDDFEYYLRITESVLSREIAPLSYIREQAVRYIMHKRKLDLLEEIKQGLYEKDLEADRIKIYVE